MICVSLQWNEFLLRLESALTSLLEGKSLDSNCSAELSRSLLGTTVVFTGRAFNIKANDLRLGIEFSDDIAIRIRDEQFAVFKAVACEVVPEELPILRTLSNGDLIEFCGRIGDELSVVPPLIPPVSWCCPNPQKGGHLGIKFSTGRILGITKAKTVAIEVQAPRLTESKTSMSAPDAELEFAGDNHERSQSRREGPRPQNANIPQLTYSFHLYSLRLSTKRREFINPFNGRLESIPDDPGMTQSDCEALQKYLKSLNADPADEDGFVKIQLPPEGFVLLRIGDLSDSRIHRGAPVELYLSKLTDRVLTFLLHLAREGHFAFGSGFGETRMALLMPCTDKMVIDRWPDAMHIYCEHDLRDWLENGEEQET